MRNKFKKVLSLITCAAVTASVYLPVGALKPVKANASESSNNTKGTVKVLEIQPGSQFDIYENSQLLSQIESRLNKTIEVDPVSMAEFVSRVDEVNGKYDIVYVGNNNSAGDYYSAVGNKAEDLPDSVKYISGSNDVEYYSGIDITNLSAKKIKEFIKSGQLTIFDESIFSDNLSDTKLYNNFYSSQEESDFYHNDKYPNFIVINKDSGNTIFQPEYGFYGEYYVNNNFNNDNKHRNNKYSSSIDFSWVEPEWLGHQKNSKYTNGNHPISVRWSTTFTADKSGKYRLGACFDGEAWFKIAKASTVSYDIKTNKIVWDGDFSTFFHGSSTWDGGIKGGEISLEKGKEYTLLVEYIPDRYKGDYNIYMHLYNQLTEKNNDTLTEAFSNYNFTSIRKRPSLELTAKPVEYNGSNAIAGANKIMGYKMNIHGQNGSDMLTSSLYIDYNGDGLYTNDEKAETFSALSGDGYIINHMLQDSYTGLQPWKIEITDQYGVKNFVKGAVAFKGNELQIHVLQLTPESNTLGLSSLGDMLKKDGEYKILVDQMSIKDFNQKYLDNKPVQLNGKYDMVVFGFADTYKNGDLTAKSAIDALDNFIKTNQSVMFTHDTIYTPGSADSNSAWGGKNLTKYFRDALGQNIYYNGHQPLPEPGKPSLGLTRLNLDRANSLEMPFTQTAFKINDTLLANYPYILPDTISVSLTHHQYFQLDLEDEQVVPVFTLDNGKMYDKDGDEIGPVETRFNKHDGRNEYYTYTKGNLTYSGTGHTRPDGIDEKRLFINTMIKAARGANHAPSLSVTGISSGQEIASTVSQLNFSILAIDDQDKYLSGSIKISYDKDGNGTIEDSEATTVETFEADSADSRLESSVSKSVTIAKNVPAAVKTFKVTVEVRDKENAMTQQDIILTQKSEPTLELSNTFKQEYLIGDKVQGTVTVKANKSITNDLDTYSDITLTAGIGLTKEMAEAGWKGDSSSSFISLNNIKFNPDPSVSEQSKNINFTCSGSEGQVQSIPLTLKYKNYSGALMEVDSSIQYSVKAGGLSVELLDAKHRGIPDVAVNVVKKNDAYFTERHGTTDSSGLAGFENLTSGEYEITIDLPEGYVLESGTSLTRTVNLSYGNPYEKVTYILTGSPVSDITFTNGNGSNSDKIYVRNGSIVNAERTAKISFRLIRDIASAEFQLDYNVPDLSITSVVIRNAFESEATCEFKNGRLLIPESFSLTKGAYEITINYNLGSSVSNGQYFGLAEKAMYVKETNAKPTDPADSYTPVLPRTVTFIVSAGAISNISLTDINGGRNVSVVENGGTQVLVKFSVNESTFISSMSLLFGDAGNTVGYTPVRVEKTGPQYTDLSNDLNSGLNNIKLEPGDYILTLYIDGTDIFTLGTTNKKLQLTNIVCLENIENKPVTSNNAVSELPGTIYITVYSLYDLE